MRKWIILFAGIMAMSAYAPEASLAQGVSVEVPGVGVQIGDPNRRERARREQWREREVRGSRCRTVTVQEETPSGMRTRTRRECN